MRNSFLCAVCFLLVGCTVINSDVVKSWDEKRIYAKLSSPYHIKPENIRQQEKTIMRQELVSRHQDWPQNIKNNIAEGEISLGMTKGQALSSWGAPLQINRTVLESGVHEQWVYEDLGVSTYVYFDDDKLTAWQD